MRQALDGTADESRNITDLAGQIDHRYNGDAWQRVLYSDSHDSAANGASRLSEEISPGNAASLYARKRSLIAGGIVMTAPAIPMLFQGQEFMTGGSFNDWQAIEWKNAETYKGIVLAYSHLSALRKNLYGNTAGLTGQGCRVFQVDDATKVIAFHRYAQGGVGDDVIVIVNFTNKLINDYKLWFPRDGDWIVRFNSSWKGYSPDFKTVTVESLAAQANNGSITLPPYSVLILSQDN
jgi:1,4-alpha-glucan branching enzyme